MANDDTVKFRVPAKLRKQVKQFAKELAVSESDAWRMLAVRGLLSYELDKAKLRGKA